MCSRTGTRPPVCPARVIKHPGVCRFKDLGTQQDFPLGAEGAGVVIAHADDVTNLPVGQPVACNSATFTEHAIVSARLCYPAPDASAEAAAVVLSLSLIHI